MKPIILFLLVGILGAKHSRAQAMPNILVRSLVSEQHVPEIKTNHGAKQELLSPVLYSYTRRKLLYKGQRISGLQLINLCRNIPDSAIQAQLECYDELTRRKAQILTATGLSGVACIASVQIISIQPSGNDVYFGAIAAGAAIGAGIAAICSSIPHQKRKAILFYYLPIAYNNYVLTH